ncbi:hypothetical protein ELG83_03650 [Rhizobium leguminosarum]|uniref:hypothetical protein n=1 Tax=Rhizobium TaxID=379 RepID=UPI001013D768|nr:MULTISPECIES: hypothetical protein [Rhizobium]NEI58010.1 hypothetical protein [Rhizobium leguminosarum]NEI83262.1 hypothetical protein [Rhizobium leguminosarum]NEI93258.1 hypothetical protein [Rhizobium leguminosarum]NEJ79053.1 hypothetical protein [Rhizobium leguminosarum]TBF39215.1 hypothetical protein ELG92_03645 [Rhizobium leguminosarum]
MTRQVSGVFPELGRNCPRGRLRPEAVIEKRIEQLPANRQQALVGYCQSLSLQNSSDHEIASGHQAIY